MKLAPAHPSRGLAGSYHELIAGPAEFYARIARQHGGIARFRTFHRWVHAVSDPDLLHQILVTRLKQYPKPRLYDNLAQMIGRGLVTLQGEAWVNDRRIIQPGFHRDCLVHLVDTANRACDRIFARWDADTATDYRPAVPAIREIGLQVIAETLLGTTLAEAQSAHLSENLMAASQTLTRKNWSLFQLSERWPTPLNRRLRHLRTAMIDFLARQVERRLAAGVGKRGDMLDLLLLAEADGRLPKDRVLSEMLTLFSAGYDTTSGGLSWAIYYLARHPAIQDQLRAEVTQLLGDRDPTWDDLDQLPFCEAVFNEAIRLNPPVHTLARTAAEPDRLGDFNIPAGSLLMLSLHGANRSPRHWTNPDVFDPDRFIRQPDLTTNNPGWQPFSSGSRRCIGAQFATVEAKLVLARLVQTFRLELQPGSKVRTAASASQHPERLFVRFAR